MALTNHNDYCRERVQQDPEFARLWHEMAVELLDGDDEDRRVSLGILRDHFGLSEDEIQAIQSARKDATRDAAYFVRFGTYKLDACDYDAAIANYDRAIALEPNDADAYHNRGIAKDALGDYAGAIADYDRVVALDPDNVAVLEDRAVAIAGQEAHTGAIADYGADAEFGSLEHEEAAV